MQRFSNANRRRDLPAGTRVAVRDRYQGLWSNGFEVAETTEHGYRLRRESDQYLLPTPFPAGDVRLRELTSFDAQPERGAEP